MSVPDTSIAPRILESAKEAFLERGYAGAQLKDICRRAGVTTGALYKRYQGKEDLFSALVQDAVRELDQAACTKEQQPPDQLTDRQLLQCWGHGGGLRLLLVHAGLVRLPLPAQG